MDTTSLPMQIKIRPDAKRIYVRRQALHAPVNQEWAKTMEKIQGMTIEVETKFLFRDQFNTVPIEGISENGLRIMDEVVESVINDARHGKARCQYCGNTSDSLTVCSHCEKTDYLQPLITPVNNIMQRRGYDLSGNPL